MIMKNDVLDYIDILEHVLDVKVQHISAKSTAFCFIDRKRYSHRDSGLDQRLPLVQRDQPPSIIKVYRAMKGLGNRTLAEALLGTGGSVAKLSGLLLERSTVITLPAIESLVLRQETGEDVGIKLDGPDVHCFVESQAGAVEVFVMDCWRGRWRAGVNTLALADIGCVREGEIVLIRTVPN